jgi:tripartite ATP-independent transporter DctM subunit
MTLLLMLMVAWFAYRNGYHRSPFPTLKVFIAHTFAAVLPLLTPAILLGGIWTGHFTATEAAAVAVAYALILDLLVYREISLKNLGRIMVETTRETAAIGFIVCAANFFGWLLMCSGLTISLAEGIGAMSTDPVVIFLVVNMFLLIVGCFMEPVVAILILGLALMPVITEVGINPLHFGVVMVLNLMIGLLTPPFGVVLCNGRGVQDAL